MPFGQVMPKFGAGKLRSGSPTGPVVKKRKQAVAIMMSEKKNPKPEYQGNVKTGPSKSFISKFMK